VKFRAINVLTRNIGGRNLGLGNLNRKKGCYSKKRKKDWEE
jgi:hypothetical protein